MKNSNPFEQFEQTIFGLENSIIRGNISHNEVIEAIKKLASLFQSKGILVSVKTSASTKLHWYTRIAIAIESTFKTSNQSISTEEFREYNRLKNFTTNIFSASGYQGTSHLMSYLTQANESNIGRDDAIKMILCLVSIEDASEDLVRIATEQTREIFLSLALGWLSERCIITKNGNNNRNKLFRHLQALDPHDIPNYFLKPLCQLWMYCSYAETERRYEVKKWVNTVIAEKVNPLASDIPLRKTTGRPTVLVILEHFRSDHAMFRCYSPVIEALRKKYKLVSLSDKNCLDQTSGKLFDVVRQYDLEPMSVDGIAKLAKEINPEFIYYPSVGMKWWTIFLVNMRIAPVQVASMGHPASTWTRTIDYMITIDQKGDAADLYSEIPIFASNDWSFVRHPKYDQGLYRKPKAKIDKLLVSVNCKVLKLNNIFLNTCKLIQEESPVQLEFHFFPSEKLAFQDGTKSHIASVFNGAVVHEAKPYEDFIHDLSKCDISLAPFPFGNANSTIDALLLDIPVITLMGAEAHSQTDMAILEGSGCAEGFVARSIDEYVKLGISAIQKIQNGERVLKTPHDRIVSKLFSVNRMQTESFYTKVFDHISNIKKVEKIRMIKINKANEPSTIYANTK